MSPLHFYGLSQLLYDLCQHQSIWILGCYNLILFKNKFCLQNLAILLKQVRIFQSHLIFPLLYSFLPLIILPLHFNQRDSFTTELFNFFTQYLHWLHCISQILLYFYWLNLNHIGGVWHILSKHRYMKFIMNLRDFWWQG